MSQHWKRHQPRLEHWRTKLAMSQHQISDVATSDQSNQGGETNSMSRHHRNNVVTSAMTLIGGLKTSSVQCHNIMVPMSRHQLKRSEENMQCRDIESAMLQHHIKAVKVKLNGPMSRHQVSNVATSVEMIRTTDPMPRHQHDIKI